MDKRKVRRNRLGFLAVTEALIILILIVILACTWIFRDTSPKSVFTSAKINQDSEVRTKAVIEKEEGYYQVDGKKILLSDPTYGQIYLPVYENVDACTYDLNSMVTRNGYTFYKKDGQIKSHFGIDVSVHQGTIDWQQVKNAGVEFAILRAGYRTYGLGEINIDEAFEENAQKAIEAGINVGVYFFSQATNTEEAIQEADALLDVISKYNITYPVVYDWELIYDDKARTDNIPVDVLTDCCISFCERVKSAGYTPMVYQNKGTTLFKLDLPRLQDYDFWLAEYSDKATYYYDYEIWQYSCTGKIPGISGDVDLNISFKDYSAE